MRKMSKYAGLLDKYGNVSEDMERHIGRINWAGHIKAQGTFSGSAFMAGYKDSFISTDLKSSSNPRGSILMEAKNYTDKKVATIGGGGVHCYIIQPQSYSGSSKYQFAFYTSKEIQIQGDNQITAAKLFSTAFPALHTSNKGGSGSYFPEIKYNVSLELYPAYGRYNSQQVLFITITEYELFVYTWDVANNKVVANKALTWTSSGLESFYWYIYKLY